MQVIKRDGRQAPFDAKKIISAINRATISVDSILNQETLQLAERIAEEISRLRKKVINVEEIQNLIEKKLMQSNRKDIAKAFIIYRNDRTRVRESKSNLMKEITDKIEAKNVENQNANMDERSFGGRLGSVNSAVLKQYALDNCMSEMAKNNHLNNEIYIHDLDHYAIGDHNCASIPFDDLLAKGFNTRQTDVRPANSIGTAFQLVAVIFQLQSLQQFGGVAATHLDWTMIPYVRKSFYKHYMDGLKYFTGLQETDLENTKDKEEISIEDKEFYSNDKACTYAMDMTKKELDQAVEGMYHNLK